MDSKVSVNILNFNTYDKTCLCIDSCLQQDYSNFRVLLIDNASTDNSFNRIKEKYGDLIEYYQTGSNYGYAGGNNLGVKKNIEDGYDYTFMLNSDTELVGKDLILSLINIMHEYNDCGIAAPLIYDDTRYGKQMIINESFYVKILRFFKVLPSNNIISGIIETKSEAHGSALLVDNNKFVSCGGFPEHFFMYAEESTLSKKMIWSGNKIYWQKNPSLYVLHHHDTTTKLEPWRLYLMGRNASLEYLENKKCQSSLWAFAFMIFAFRSLVRFFKKESRSHFKGLIDGFILYYKGYDKSFIYNQGKESMIKIV